MINNIKENGKMFAWLLLPLLVTAVIASCSKMDDYKKYTEGGEISYTGKIDSVKVFSGHNRVVIRGLFLADPKVSICKVYWNNMADSIIVPVTRNNTVDTLNVSVPNVKEGIQNFIIYTYDKNGNKSIPVYKTGRAYGDRYQSSLTNRSITAAQTSEKGETAIIWQGMDRLTGVFATEVVYTNSSNVAKTILVPIDQDTTNIPDFKTSSSIKYRTLFMPDTVSIDTFKTEYTERLIPKFTKTDVTNLYLKNAGTPLKSSSSGSRWGILADWTTTAPVKNASGFGGFEIRSGVGFISLEAGWGLPDVTNGMIYQTTTLPAGSYSFELGGVDQDTKSTKYIVVANGTSLPNVTDVPSKSIAYVSLSSATKLAFTLTEPTTVSIGFAATLTGGSGSAGFYTKIKYVNLYTTSYL